MQTLNRLTPIKVIRHPSSVLTGFPGERVMLHVSVINQGDTGAAIEVFLNPTYPTPSDWCASEKERVTLDSQQAYEVSLPFDLPMDAVPGRYPYTLVVDAPEHYPEETPLQYPSHLEVLVKEQETNRLDGPQISISPVSGPEKPIPIQPGHPQQLILQVQNCSSRVDRFRLACLDLNPDWFATHYPDTDLRELGLLTEADGLELNPGDIGEIVVDFQFPLNIPAGHYSPTFQLLSENTPEQIQLEVVYLAVKPKAQLGVELETILGKVTHSEGLYRLRLTNHGNLIRELSLTAEGRGEQECCTYDFEPDRVRLLMGDTAEVSLKVRPNQNRRRPFFGFGLDLPFQIQIQDSQGLAIPEKLPTGHLIWKARPWWQFLLILLAGVTALSGAGLLIWFAFFRPAPPPKVKGFEADSPQYIEGDRVRLNWSIENFDQLESLAVSSVMNESPDDSRVYDFTQGVPAELAPDCQVRDRLLTCMNVDTGARAAGNYTFQLEAEAKKSETVVENSMQVVIQPKPLPEIGAVTSSVSELYKGQLLPVSWTLKNFSHLNQLQVFSQLDEGMPALIKTYNFKQQQIPAELQKQCQLASDDTLTCRQVNLGLPSKAGKYSLTIQPIASGSTKQSSPSKPIPVQLKAPLPQITVFTLNGKSAETNPSSFVQSGQKMTLKWQVKGDNLKVKLDPLGDVQSSGSKSLQATQGLSQITLTAQNEQGQSVNQSFLVQVNPPKSTQKVKESVNPLVIQKGFESLVRKGK